MNFFNETVDAQLLTLHTAFVGKITSMHGDDRATVQPLNMVKQRGRDPEKQALLVDVPILEHVRHVSTFSAGYQTHGGHVKIEPLKKGDVVLCVCCERDITDAIRGKMTVPPIGHHQLSDAVIVGCFSGK